MFSEFHLNTILKNMIVEILLKIRVNQKYCTDGMCMFFYMKKKKKWYFL